jgi:hypothetical protein
VVIDWRNSEEGSPEIDVALTALIMAEIVVAGFTDLAGQAAAAIPLFLRYAGLDLSGALYQAAVRRAADPCLDQRELQRLPLAVAWIADCHKVP